MHRHAVSRVARVSCHLPLVRPAASVAWHHPQAAIRTFWVPRRRDPSVSLPSPPLLPDPTLVRVANDCALECIDLPPTTASDAPSPTLVLLHGAPGTYRDYRYLIPLLQQQLPTSRVVGLNMPGFGGSTVDERRYVELLDASRATALTLQALEQLVPRDERVVLVGHSFGGHAILKLAALNAATSASPLTIDGLVLLASAGTRPHRVLRPHASALAVRLLALGPPMVRHALSHIVKTFYTVLLGFSADFPSSHFVAGVVRAGTTDFSTVQDDVTAVRAAQVPSLSAWSADDAFMEDAIPTALAETLCSSKRLAFRGAGHNLQKTRADVLALEIAAWIHTLPDAPSDRSNTPIETRP